MKGICTVINTVYYLSMQIKYFYPLDPRSNLDKNVIVFLCRLCVSKGLYLL